ncbi:MAG: putative ABC transporter permease [Oscillospiraceae bacterium]|nr:putative ABC transporter permease [Oscillospiraceae bacterium]
MIRLLWIFFLYSLIGFGLELLFARATRASKRDRKCLLFLPLCPVYGLGAVLILSLPEALRQSPWLLAACAALCATGAEYGTAFFYERVWHVRFWDYSALPLQLHGRVCLPFSLIWAGLSLPLVYWLQPRLDPLLAALPGLLVLPLCLVFLADSLMTGNLLRRAGNTKALIWYG